MAAGRHLEKKENRHISAAISDIFTKFGVLVDIGSPHCPLVLFLDYNKIHLSSYHQIWHSGIHGQSASFRNDIFDMDQNPTWRPAAISKKENRHISAGF